MGRLTEKKFWERNYETDPVGTSAPVTPAVGASGFNQRLKSYLGKSLTDHSNHVLWEVFLAKLLPKDQRLKVLEIGSAPGGHLILLKKKFNYSPYGIEYTEAGWQVNRDLFTQNGIDPTQVIQADAFSPALLEQYEGYFDVVVSFGFVEHFDDVRWVIQRHLDFLKEGGWLVVQIPRLTKFNYWMAHWFNRETLAMHNLHIMQKAAFKELFVGLPVEETVCDYVGAVKLHLSLPYGMKGWRGQLINAIKNVQMLLNVILHWLFPGKGGETASFSPYLVFVGRKVANAPKSAATSNHPHQASA